MKLLEKVGSPLLFGPLGGVAQANLKAISPKAQPTTTPANSSFTFILLMIILLSGVGAAKHLAALGSAVFAKRAAVTWILFRGLI